MGLPDVRRVVVLKASRQDNLCVAAAAAGDCRVDDVDTRVGLPEVVEEHIQSRTLRTRRPPGQDLEVLGATADTPRSALTCLKDEREASYDGRDGCSTRAIPNRSPGASPARAGRAAPRPQHIRG